jgi:hypothetical protein
MTPNGSDGDLALGRIAHKLDLHLGRIVVEELERPVERTCAPWDTVLPIISSRVVFKS